MALLFERIHTAGIAQLSYLVGDDGEGRAAIIDPRPDCDIYLDLAQRLGVAITDIFETHIHADFMSGARELCARLGGVPIHVGHAGSAEYGFPTESIGDSQDYEYGDLRMTARHTPGHTPEHVSFALAETRRERQPFAILSGDTLFVDSVGRPDLLGEDETRVLAAQLFRSVRDCFGRLDDGVALHPGHGAGSACGPDIGDRQASTIGYEKRFNPYVRLTDEKQFIEKVLSTAPPEPRHYRPLKKLNAAGPPTFGGLPPVPPLTAEKFREVCEGAGRPVLDTRDILSFGGGHIRGALNIGARPELSVWSGQMLDFDTPLLLVLPADDQLESVVRLLWRTGHTKFAGYLVGGMTAWDNRGFALERLPQASVHELKDAIGDGVLILDVRSPAEWESGHAPGAEHAFVPDVRRKAQELDRDRPVITYCDSGYRASLAASVLKQEGFTKVRNVPGSMQAWKSAGYPLEIPGQT